MMAWIWWTAGIVGGALVWYAYHRFRLRVDRRYRMEYEHRAGLATLPSPHGRMAVPSDEALRVGLRDLGLTPRDIRAAPDPAIAPPSPFDPSFLSRETGRGPAGSPGGPV